MQGLPQCRKTEATGRMDFDFTTYLNQGVTMTFECDLQNYNYRKPNQRPYSRRKHW